MSITRRNREGIRARRLADRMPGVCLTLQPLEDRTAPAAVPVAMLQNVPTEQLLGENLQFTVRFDNASPTDVGFGPYIDLYLPATGVDGAGSPPNDGVSFVGATYLGTPVMATVLTLTAAGVPHPYAKGTNGNPILILPPAGFRPGDQLVVLQVPYGSFTPAQNPADITVTTALSNLADINVPLPIQAQGGFRFGNDALDNPGVDPTIVGPATSSNVTPTLYRLTKTYIGPEDETTTGPNFPRQYRISVDVATGQVLTNLDLTDVLPAELQFIAVDSTSGPVSSISTPSTTTPGGTLTRRFASVTGTAGAIDAQMTFSFYAPRINAPLSPILDPAFGGQRANNGFRNGLRVRAGAWLDDCQRCGIEADYFFLGNSTDRFTASSPNGTAVIARPIIDAVTGLPAAELISFPGVVAGTVGVESTSEFQGWGIRYLHNLCCSPCGRLDLTVGYRHLNLTDGLTITEDLTSLTQAGVPPGTRLQIVDRFRTENDFYGPSIGMNFERRYGRLFVGGRVSAALGVSRHEVTIDGRTTITPPGALPTSFSGGLLALPSNIGRSTDNQFAVVPDAGLRVGAQLTPGLRGFVGYDFLYWSDVARAGDQIDIRVNTNQLAPPRPLSGPALPARTGRTTDVWVQGVSVGVEWRY